MCTCSTRKGERSTSLAVHPDADALRTLANRVLRHGEEVSAVIESMTGSRFVHDTLERLGWDVMIADAVKAKGVCTPGRQDRQDRRSRAGRAGPPRPRARDLAARSTIRAERERARFRLHLVHHRSALKCRIHATLMTFCGSCRVWIEPYHTRVQSLYNAGLVTGRTATPAL